MSNISKGMVAGFAATVVLSALMAMKQAMGLMPELDPIGMLNAMAGARTPAIGWIMHFMIGTIAWGGAFALIHGRLPGAIVTQGIVFGLGAWLLMMLMVMPMAGAGLFGLGIGMVAPVMTLLLHIVFGAVLGWTYGRLAPADGSRTIGLVQRR